MPEGEPPRAETPRPSAAAPRPGVALAMHSSPGESTPFVSRAVRATRESASLRVTIPQVVASTLGLRPGDDLVWIVDPLNDQVHVAALRREAPASEAETPLPEVA
jgi:hypothetical protein